MTPVTIVSRRAFLRLSHTFFAFPGAEIAADVQRAIQVAEPPPVGGWSCTEFHTLHLDLTCSEEALRSGLKEGVRTEVKRALERDPFRIEILDPADTAAAQRFLDFHAREAAAAALPPADAFLLDQLARRGALVLGTVRGPDGKSLACHATIVASGRARLLFSAIARGLAEPGSAAAVGRANRLLHWKELLHFRGRELAIYDFGGLALTASDARLEGIDRFKRGFGGRIVTEYKCRRAATAIGRLALVWERAAVSARGVVTRRAAARREGKA